MSSDDFAAQGLLDGLKGKQRQAREQLLERLSSDGFTLEELKAAVAEDRLVLLPVERVLGGRYTAHEIAERSDVPADQMMRVRRALGFPEASPEDPVWSEEDVAAARSIKQFLDAGMSEESVVEITRVLGEGMSKLGSTIIGNFADTYLEPGDTERDVALRYAAMAKALLPSLTPVLSAALSAYVREFVRRGIISRGELERGQLTTEGEAVVCFADLVGFTSLGGEVGSEELGSVARQLADLAADVATPPVRLIKTIGDAAMFVSAETPPMVEAAVSLVEAVQAADLPSLRAGIASGPALNRAGDWYGHSVNLASRVTGIARPDSVLCTQEVRDAAPDQFEWSFAGKHRLKGITEPQPLHRARGLQAPEPAEPKPGRREKPPAETPRKRRADRRRKRESR
jgi:adenylate cyclase